MKSKKNNIEQPSLLEQEIVRVVDKAIKDSKVNLAAEDVKVIAREIMPDLDRIISEKVKMHFFTIGQYIMEKFSMGE